MAGWGVAETGQQWQTAGGSDSDYDVGASGGRVILADDGVYRQTWVGDYSDVDLTASVSCGSVVSGGPIEAGLVVRHVNTSNYYVALLVLGTDGGATLRLYRRVDGSLNTIGNTTVTVDYSPGVATWIRIRAVGSNLTAKAWQDQGSEPAWQITADDATFGSGAVGTMSVALTSNTNGQPTLTYANFSTAPGGRLPDRWEFAHSVDGGAPVPVRSGDPAWSPGGVGIAYDHEAPLGVPVTFSATPVFHTMSLDYGNVTAAASSWETYYWDSVNGKTDWSDYPLQVVDSKSASIVIPVNEYHVSSAGISVLLTSAQQAGIKLVLSADLYMASGGADILRTRWRDGPVGTGTNVDQEDNPGPPPGAIVHISRSLVVPDGQQVDRVQVYLTSNVQARSMELSNVAVYAVTDAAAPDVTTAYMSTQLDAPAGISQAWIKSVTDPSLSALVQVSTWPELSYAGRSTTTNVLGRHAPAADVQPYVSPTSTMTINADGDEVGKVRAILQDRSVLLIQIRPEYHRADQQVVIASFTETLLGRVDAGVTQFAVELAAVARPATANDPLRIPGWTVADLAAQYATIEEVTAAFDNVQALATGGRI